METMKVKDLMIPLGEYVCISGDDTIYEAVVALEQARKNYEAGDCPHRAVLVCDKSGRVIGKLTYLDLLRALEPKYSELADLRKFSGFGLSAEFLKSMIGKFDLWQAPLDDLCRKAADVNVRNVVASPIEGEMIEQEASLNRGIHQLIMGHFQSLLVTSKGDIVGVLRLTDVFAEVGKRIKACRI